MTDSLRQPSPQKDVPTVASGGSNPPFSVMNTKQPTQEQVKKACKLCKKNNGSSCTQVYSPDPNHWICKAWLARAGYSGQSGV